MTSTPATPDPRPTRLVARSRDDLVAMVPVVLGFVPSESVTLLTFDAARVFHARVDLPHDAADDLLLVEAFLEPARRHRVRTAAVVVHTPRPARFEQVARPLLRALLSAGVRVVDVLRADLGAVWCLDCDEAPRPGAPCAGHPCAVGSHRFAAQAVLDGRVVHSSREELAATLVPDAATLARRPGVREAALAHDHRLAAAGSLAREATWLRRTLRRHLLDDTRLDDLRLGRLLADLGVVALRDRAWERMDRASATREVELWRDVVRRAPTELCGPPAGVLAYAAWLRGDGALAWCAVERGLESGQDVDLVGFVSELLVRAEPPDGHRVPPSTAPTPAPTPAPSTVAGPGDGPLLA
ncbi:DUF4192 domain-containing protein [Nocardioides lentus]|uniref:DUF4192 domain-containing protein n=1 Tax=Nocardioides lentus TaxID=338077 RepID=A0ABN2P784_9ACTN